MAENTFTKEKKSEAWMGTFSEIWQFSDLHFGCDCGYLMYSQKFIAPQPSTALETGRNSLSFFHVVQHTPRHNRASRKDMLGPGHPVADRATFPDRKTTSCYVLLLVLLSALWNCSI
jgi:hypothetical protein